MKRIFLVYIKTQNADIHMQIAVILQSYLHSFSCALDNNLINFANISIKNNEYLLLNVSVA